jgi:hypothetical protein
VAWVVEFENGEQELHFEEPSVGETITPLYTTPPQRPWVGLTGELTRNELLELANTFYTGGFTEREIAFARVVLAKSKEKNT